MTNRKLILLTSIFWCGVFGSCATGDIKTWIIVPGQLEHNSGNVAEFKTYAEAQGFRCYSEVDDRVWRTRMNDLDACCSAK